MGNYITLLYEQDQFFTDQNEKLVKAKKFIKTILDKKPTFEVRFSNTVVLTTDPDKWERYKKNNKY